MSERSRRSPPGTWRLFAPGLVAWAACAWCVATPGAAPYLLWASALCGAGVCGYAVLRRRSRRSGRPGPGGGDGALGALLLLCAVLLVLLSRVSAQEWARAEPALHAAAKAGEPVKLRAALAGFPRRSEALFGDRFWVRAEAETPRGGVPILIRLDADPGADWAPGVGVELTARLQRLPPGGAAFAAGVRLEGTAGAVGEAETHGLLRQTPLGEAGRVAARLRAELRAAAERVPGAELVPGFAVGDTALVGEELDAAMRQSSLTHLTAVSGANCALVTAAVMGLLARLGLGRRPRALAGAAALLGFLVVVGPDPSVQRAAVMASVLLVSRFGGRRAVALPSLGAAMIVLLGIDPWQALQPGFALSVAATAGILLAADPLARWSRRALRVPRWLALPIGVALAAQFACGPLLLLLQPGLPVAGVLANVVAGPAAPLGTALGLFALLLLPLEPVLGSLAVALASLPAWWVGETARLAAALPAARWNWPEGWWGAALLALCQGGLVLAWALARGRISLPRGGRAPPRRPWHAPEPPPRPVRLAAAALGALAIGIGTAVVLVTPVMGRLGTPAGWAVVACDVGQGDALLLRDPAAPDRVMLVDTGDDPEALPGCLDRFGVERISLLVLTHDDADHVGALDSIADRVEAALISPTVSGERTEHRRVVGILSRAGVPTRIGAAGDRSARTGSAEHGPRWRVLAPAAGSDPADTNAASLVMLARAGSVGVLLLADTGLEEQSELLASGADLRADVLKVAHHGSSDQDPALPAAVGARWGLVSVGADNRYGHPTAASLDSLRTAGTRTLRTDRHGSIALVPGADGDLSVWVERGGGPARSDVGSGP